MGLASAGRWIISYDKKQLAHFCRFWGLLTWIFALRAFSTLMSANWPLMIVNVFFVGYGAPCPSMVQAQRSCGNGR